MIQVFFHDMTKLNTLVFKVDGWYKINDESRSQNRSNIYGELLLSGKTWEKTDIYHGPQHPTRAVSSSEAVTAIACRFLWGMHVDIQISGTRTWLTSHHCLILWCTAVLLQIHDDVVDLATKKPGQFGPRITTNHQLILRLDQSTGQT